MKNLLLVAIVVALLIVGLALAAAALVMRPIGEAERASELRAEAARQEAFIRAAAASVEREHAAAPAPSR